MFRPTGHRKNTNILEVITLYIVHNRLVGLVGSVFANNPGDLGLDPGRVIPKWYWILPFLTVSNIRYVSRLKWSNLGKGVAPS